MKNRMVIVTDLGSFKAYKLDQNPLHSSPRLELVDSFTPIEAHEKLSEQTADQAGQFSKGSRSFTAINDMANGERHNIELEQRRRLIKLLAGRMNHLLGNGDVDGCYFAAHNDINHHILDELEPAVRAKIEKNVPHNLTKTDKAELLKHF